MGEERLEDLHPGRVAQPRRLGVDQIAEAVNPDVDDERAERGHVITGDLKTLDFIKRCVPIDHMTPVGLKYTFVVSRSFCRGLFNFHLF